MSDIFIKITNKKEEPFDTSKLDNIPKIILILFSKSPQTINLRAEMNKAIFSFELRSFFPQLVKLHFYSRTLPKCRINICSKSRLSFPI